MNSDKSSKEIMGRNIRFYLDRNGKTVTDLMDALNLKKTTVYSWLQGKSYPRIDKIEAMAEYFGISNAELVESHENDIPEHINLDEALSKQGVVMEFQGKELSDKAKKKILDILKIVDGDED